MREQLSAVAKTVEVLHDKRDSVDIELLPGFEVAVETLETFFIECYEKLLSRAAILHERLIIDKRCKRLLSELQFFDYDDA